MAKYYGWDHHFWKRMGVREFERWCEVTKQQGERSTDPESWDGYESDPFWQQAHARR